MSGELHKSAFGGFKRKEVLDYIEQINMRANEKEEQLNKKLSEATEAKKELEEAAAASNKKAAALETILKEKDEQAQVLSKENLELTKKLEEAQAALAELAAISASTEEKLRLKDAELTATQKKAEQLTAQLEEKAGSLELAQARLSESVKSADSSQLRELKEKSEKYDELTHQLGQVFIDAHERADLMLDNAAAQVHTLAESTNASAKEMVGDFIALQENVQQIRACVNTSLDIMNQQLLNLSKELEAAIQRLENGVAVSNEKPKPCIKTPDFIEKAMEEARATRNPPQSSHTPVIKQRLFESLVKRDKK